MKSQLPSESLALRLLKLLIYEIGILIVTSEISSTAGVLGAALSAPIAFLAAQKIAELPTRRSVTLGAITLLLLLCSSILPAFMGSQFISDIIGINNALTLADFIDTAAVAFSCVLLIRVASFYYASLTFLEASLVLFFFAWKLGVHRDLALHRPQGLADYAWDHGSNPVVILMFLGAALFAFTATLALRTRRLGQTLVQIILIFIIAISLFAFYHDRNIKVPEKNNTFGLSGANDPDDYKRGKGGDGDNNQNGQGNQGNNQGNGGQNGGSGQNDGSSSGSSSGKSNNNEMPFKNDYSQQQNSPAALVKFLTDYSSPDGYYYFRQTAFSTYNGNRLVQTSGPNGDTDIFADLPATGTATAPVDPAITANVFKDIPIEVYSVFPPTKPFGLANVRSVTRINNPNSSFFSTAWSSTAQAFVQPPWEFVKLSPRPSLPKWNSEKMELYTQYPKDERYSDLANEIIAPYHINVKDNPLFAMAAITEYLSKNAYYSLKSDHADAIDPTADFLFGNRTGYCVHFAHAAVYLARSLGLPARVGGGYMVNEKRRANGENLMIMERDAHAWPEIYLQPYGWIIMDVPIQNYLDPPVQEPSQSLQKTLSQMAKEGGEDGKPKAEEIEKPKNNLEKMIKAIIKKALEALKKIIPPLLLAGLICSWLYKLWRRIGWRFTSGRTQLILAHQGVIDRLHDRNLRRPFGMNREEFARSLATQLPLLQQLTWALLAAKLGKNWQLDEQNLKTLMTQLLQEVGNIPLTAKTVLRIINPFSWIGRR